MSSPREREKRDRRDSRGDEREGQGKKRKRSESEETEETKTFPFYPYLLQGQQAVPNCKPIPVEQPGEIHDTFALSLERQSPLFMANHSLWPNFLKLKGINMTHLNFLTYLNFFFYLFYFFFFLGIKHNLQQTFENFCFISFMNKSWTHISNHEIICNIQLFFQLNYSSIVNLTLKHQLHLQQTAFWFFFFSFSKKMSWDFMWNVYLADSSHEMSTYFAWCFKD